MSAPLAVAPAANSTTAELLDQRNAHTRVWEVAREVETTLPDGRTSVETVKSRICEKASGLCYRDADGEWAPSVPEWRETADGFVIDRCGYGLFVGKTIGTGVRYTIYGQDVTFRPARLAIFDGADEAQLATLTADTQGFVTPGSPAVLRFPNAFGPGYDLEYVAEKDGFHQNLVIWGAPSAPLSVAADSCQFEIWTEVGLESYLSASPAEIVIGTQVAFDIDGAAGVPAAPGVPIEFSSHDPSGETLSWFLADSAVWDSSTEAALPSRTCATRELRREAESGKVCLVETLPIRYFNGAKYPVVVDFVSKSGDFGGVEEWTPENTYYISGDLNISGTVTILPGTVVKLKPGVSMNLIKVSLKGQPVKRGKVIARGEPYDYIVFTNAADNTCGQPIDPPPPAGRWERVFDIYSGSSPDTVIQYCKLGHGQLGIYLRQVLNQPVSHNIFRDMYSAIQPYGISSLQFHNNLLAQCTSYAIYAYNVADADYTNNTIDCAGAAYSVGLCDHGSTYLTATDNLFSNCHTGVSTNNYYYSVVDHDGFWRCTTPVSGTQMGPNSVVLGYDDSPYYDPPCSVGEFYLNNTAGAGAELRDRPGGRTAEAAGLAGAEFTVKKPGVAAASVTSNRYWLKHEPDTDIVDIGYHHNRVDWVLDGADTVVTNSGLVLVPGLVVAIDGSGTTLRIGTEGKIISLGDPYERGPNIIASKRSVSMGIESSLKLYPVYGQNESQVGITLSADSIFDSRIRHTIFRGLYKAIQAQRWCLFPIKHCRFDQNIIGIESYGGTVSAMNNVFAWNETGLTAALPTGARAEFRNNTFDGNWWEGLHLNTVSGSTAIIKDNLFTSNNCGIQVYGAGDIQYGHNGFYGNTTPEPQPYPKEGDVFLLASSPYYKEGVITKRWFLDQNTALINGGSTTTVAAKLLPYVTAYSQSYDVGSIDIGCHAFTGTGPANPDPDAPTITITEIRDQFDHEPPFFLEGVVDITVETTGGPSDSTGIVQLYVDGEFVGRANPLTSGGGVGANAFALSSWTLLNTDDMVYPGSLGDWSHTVQALAESLKPATGRSEPICFETVNYLHCLSTSGQELDLSGQQGIEMSALGFRTVDFEIGHQVVIRTLQPGWMWGFPEVVPFDPRVYNQWDSQRWQVADLGVRGPSHVLHETWDGTDSEGQQVYDGLYRLDIGLDMGYPQMVLYSWVDVSAFSTPVTEAEVALFLPDFTHWDVLSAQAVIDACWRLNLPYRVLIDQSANWDNMKAFLTCPRPPDTYPSVLYFSGHGYNILDLNGQKYTVTYFWFGDDRILATTSPPEGNLPEDFIFDEEHQRMRHHVISDPAYGKYGLKDPRYLDEYGNPIYELSETGWVKFVWMHACYSNVIPLDDKGKPMWFISDMATAFGMGSYDNRELFQDQSYIGFIGPTPFSWYNQWISTVYTWTFWYYLSEWGGGEPTWPVGWVWAEQVPNQITLLWPVLGYPWTPFLEYMVALCDVSYYSLTAKLKDHR